MKVTLFWSSELMTVWDQIWFQIFVWVLYVYTSHMSSFPCHVTFWIHRRLHAQFVTFYPLPPSILYLPITRSHVIYDFGTLWFIMVLMFGLGFGVGYFGPVVKGTKYLDLISSTHSLSISFFLKIVVFLSRFPLPFLFPHATVFVSRDSY